MENKQNIITEKVSYIEVCADMAGQRIDNYLLCALRRVPKSLVYRILRSGEVRINSGRVKPSYKVQVGDKVRVPPIKISEPKPVTAAVTDNIVIPVIYEDANVMVINKPINLAVHGGSGISYGVIEILRAQRNDLHYLELVHRIDRATSGCLLLAKKRSALRSLHAQLRDGTNRMEKLYHAIVAGVPSQQHLICKAPLLKKTRQSGERYVIVHPEGKSAKTKFSILDKGKKHCLMAARLITGRTHQIRVHLAHLGYSIIGDAKYGTASDYSAKRMCLHAKRLKFTCPTTAERISVTADYDAAWQQVLQDLFSS